MNIKNEKGSTIILFALVITVIIGFVGLAVDFGYAVLKDLQLTNAIDAATLAGARDLDDTTEATLTAQTYLQNNGINPNTVTITFSDNNHSIRLESNTVVNNRFMKLLGINTTGIGASAKASKGNADGVSGIRPFGIEYPGEGVPYERYDDDGNPIPYTLKTGDATDDDYGAGNFGALSLGGTGASVLLDNALNGYDGTIKIGDIIDTEPGNMVGILKPIQDMFDGPNPDKFWVLPIISTFVDINGKSQVTVIDFAVFEVLDVKKNAGEVQITGQFVEKYVSGAEIGESGDYDLYTIKLVE